MGPHREKEGSFYAIREIFSPVHIKVKELPADFAGVVPVENRYHFTNLNSCSFSYKLMNFNKPVDWLAGYTATDEKAIPSPYIAPGKSGQIRISLPSAWKDYDAIVLIARAPSGDIIYEWTWKTGGTKDIVSKFITLTGTDPAAVREADTLVTLAANGTSATFSKQSGKLVRVAYNNRSSIMFGNGPVLTSGDARLTGFRTYAEGDRQIAEAED